MRLFEIENKFKNILKDEYEIADYISETSSDYVDHDFIVDYFRGAMATLKTVNIDDVTEGNKDGNIRSKSKEKKYLKLSPETMPPLVVENGTIMDGNHRYRIAKKLGLKQIKIYDVTER